MEAVWGRMEVVGKCSVDEGCGLRAIPAGGTGMRGGGGDGVTESPPGSRVTPRGSRVAPRGSRVTPQRRTPLGSPLCTAMTGRWCCVKLLRRGEESCGEGLLKGDLSISVFTLGEMPVGPGGGGVRGRAPHGNGVLWGVRVCVKQHGGVQQWCAAVRTGFALVQLCACVCVCTDLCACATLGMRLGTRVRAWMCSSTSVCARLCADLRVSEHTTHMRQHVVVWVCSACTLRARALCVHEHIHGAGLAPSPRCSGHPQSPNVGQDVGLTAASPKHGGGWLR